jgi:glycogen debranching enzyme
VSSRSRPRAALNWIGEYADLQGNGLRLVPSARNEKTGLENQCWKDSWDSISFRTAGFPGSRARPASCRVTHTTRSSAARAWHGSSGRTRPFADRLEEEAADLKRRFNRDFWVEDGEYFALALDPDGEQVDALASNNGHLLWSGIVDKSKAKAVAGHLLGPRLFSAGACAPWPREKGATTRSATTSARSGPSTTRSSPGDCGGTGSRTKLP